MGYPSSRWRRSRRVAFAGAGQSAVPLWPVDKPADVLHVNQLTISADAAAEVVVYFGNVAADRLIDDRAIDGLFLGANGGAAPDLSCRGAWSPLPGLPIQIWASAACNVWVELAGTVEDDN